MEIPKYRVENIVRHLDRIVANCRAAPFDSQTANALRLARKDLAALRKYMASNNASNHHSSPDNDKLSD